MIRNHSAAFADYIRALHIEYHGSSGADMAAEAAHQLYEELTAHRGEMVLLVSHDLTSRGRGFGQAVLDRVYRLGFTTGAPVLENADGSMKFSGMNEIPCVYHQAWRSTGWDNSWNFLDVEGSIPLDYLVGVNKPMNLAQGLIVPPWTTPAPLLYKEVIVGSEQVADWFAKRGTTMVELFNQLVIRLEEQCEVFEREVRTR